MRVSGNLVLQSPHGVEVARADARVWNGITVHAIELTCSPGKVWHDITSDRPCANIILEQLGGRCHARTKIDQPCRSSWAGPQHIDYSPPGMRLWGYSEGMRRLRGARFFFDFQQLGLMLGEDIDMQRIDEPRLHFHDDRIVKLGELLAAECERPQESGDLYGDSLTVALVIDLLRLGKHQNDGIKRGALAPWQLRRAMDFMDANLATGVRLDDLARMTGLSQSQFGRAFKASTGMAPHRWQLHARITRAQELLLDSALSIAQVALATGFSEQSHLTRVFRSVVGTSPGAWQRERRR